MSTLTELTDIQREVLKEVGNIGAGHAATALADIMKLSVGLTEPTVAHLRVPGAVKTSYDERLVSALRMEVLGEAPGEIIILFDNEESSQFVKRFLTMQIGEIEVTQELIDATLMEIANIIGGSYLSALADLLNKNLMPSTPTLTFGPLDEVLEKLTRVDGDPQEHREAFLINNGFINERGRINVQFLFLPKDGSLGPYLAAFGVTT